MFLDHLNGSYILQAGFMVPFMFYIDKPGSAFEVFYRTCIVDVQFQMQILNIKIILLIIIQVSN